MAPVIEWDLPVSVAQASEWLSYQDPAVEGNEGDQHTYNTVCSLRDFGISEAECFRLLNEGDESGCQPASRKLSAPLDEPHIGGIQVPWSM